MAQKVSLAKENINDQMALELGRRVVTGAYAVDGKMPGEMELAREFSVGRTSVREAMRRLASWGMVLVRPKHKSVVLPKECWQHFDPIVLRLRLEHGQTEDVFRDLSEIRLSIEPSVAYLAAARARPEDISEMVEALNQMNEPGMDVKELAVYDAAFHRAIFKACGNHFFNSFFTALESILTVGISGHQKVRNRKTTRSEHLHILDRIRDADQNGAKLAMIDHLTKAVEENRGLFGL